MSVATIGSALAEKRRELGLEKGQAADKIGMSRTTYSSYEQDAQRPSVDVFPALAQFLEVSMEELLTLYGATCVAAVRPSLERLLSDQSGDKEAPVTEESSSRLGADVPSGSDALIDETDSYTDVDDSPIEVVPELEEVTTLSDTQDQKPASLTESDASEEATESDSESTNEVVLELQETTTQSEALGQAVLPLPDLEGLEESDQIPDSSESHDESFDQSDVPPQPAEPSLGLIVFEPSPYFMRTSISESQAKNSETKKKKKKKKKK